MTSPTVFSDKCRILPCLVSERPKFQSKPRGVHMNSMILFDPKCVRDTAETLFWNATPIRNRNLTLASLRCAQSRTSAAHTHDAHGLRSDGWGTSLRDRCTNFVCKRMGTKSHHAHRSPHPSCETALCSFQICSAPVSVTGSWTHVNPGSTNEELQAHL